MKRHATVLNITFGLVLMAVAGGHLLTKAHADMNESDLVTAIDATVQRSYEELRISFQTLRADLDQHCDSPTQESLASVRNAYKRAFLQWKEIDFIQTGPIALNSRSWQIQFWPDPRDLVKMTSDTYVRQAKGGQNVSLNKFGVAVKGLTSIEYFLFSPRDDKHNSPDASHCSLVEESAENLVGVVSDLVDEYPVYVSNTTTSERMEDYFRSAMTTLSILEERRIAEPFGIKRQRVIYQLSESWRSGLAFKAMARNLDGLWNKLIIEIISRPSVEKTDFANVLRMSDQDIVLIERLEKLPFPPTQEDMKVIQESYEMVQSKKQSFRKMSAELFGIRKGFSFNDGD